jgi:hypothetical protein
LILPLLAMFAVSASTLVGQQRNMTPEERARLAAERER